MSQFLMNGLPMTQLDIAKIELNQKKDKVMVVNFSGLFSTY